MSINPETKKKVYNSWIENFPSLISYTKGKFYKVVGPVVIGLEMIKLPFSDEYRPHFVIYPLWRPSEKECMNVPLLMIQLYDKRGFQFDIPYEKHDKYAEEAFRRVEEQMISLKHDVEISQFLLPIDEHLKRPFGPADAASKLELKLFLAVYIGNWTLTESTLDEIHSTGILWDQANFEYFFGPFEAWYKSLESQVRNRGVFLQQIDLNLKTPKFSKLKRSELLP